MSIKNIDPKTLSKWLKNDEAVLIDVREAVEYKEKSIPNSHHLPLSQVNIKAMNDIDYKNKKLVIHCKGGKRSMAACEKLKNEGLKCDIWNLEGGIDNWENSGLLIKKPKKEIISAQRQLQIIIGSIVVLGLVMNYFSNNNYWLILPLIAGVGLLNAGITGWCGLMKLLSIMPWNK